MSLDISLLDNEGDEIASLNWLRNPFGLCNWAEDNVKEPTDKITLWDVCNKWSYDESVNVDRKLFKSVVDEYHTRLLRLSTTYFKFNDNNLRQFIHPYIEYFSLGIDGSIRGSLYCESSDIVSIPLSYFDYTPIKLSRGNISTHEHYFKWYGELVEFAELLQDESYTFHCTN